MGQAGQAEGLGALTGVYQPPCNFASLFAETHTTLLGLPPPKLLKVARGIRNRGVGHASKSRESSQDTTPGSPPLPGGCTELIARTESSQARQHSCLHGRNTARANAESAFVPYGHHTWLVGIPNTPLSAPGQEHTVQVWMELLRNDPEC